MTVISYPLKTHSRTDITNQFDNLNECFIHHCKPTILDIVAGRHKEHHFVASCISDHCGKISSVSGQDVVNIWNNLNNVNQTPTK